jgi:DNA-binding FadR family transcriptional regulator
VPHLAKKLGDGVVLVWELDGDMEKDIDRGVRYAVLDIVGYVQEYFYRLVEKTKRANPQREFDVELGIGLAAGSAWRHDYPPGGHVDYSGPPMNLAARLQDKARPKGVCVDAADYESLYLLERAWCDEGEVTVVKVSGISDPIKVWLCTEEPLRIRRPRNLQGASLKDLKVFLNKPYLERPRQNVDRSSRRTLSRDDLQTLLELREDKEASFARQAATRGNAISTRRLQSLLRQMKTVTEARKRGATDIARFRNIGQRFHEAIAFSSGANARQCQEHSKIVSSLHEYTTKNRNYPKASSDLKEMLREHEEIAEAIRAKLPDLAEERMRKHLQKHHDRVRARVFGPSSVNNHSPKK